MPALRPVAVVAVWLALFSWPSASWAQRYQPSLRFYTLSTAHFEIHFHEGERALADRVAVLAEEVRTALLRDRPGPEPGRTHVIISGQDDVPNGWATPVPFNTIEIRSVWPRPSAAIGNTTDWLRLVLTHEYAHILHLDRSRGVFSAARQVFGRVPFAMPNLFLPIWQVEGLATWRESTATPLGRVNDGTARRVLSAARRNGSFGPIDRTGGGLVTWPSGEGSYFYGGLFHDYLARRFGADSLERLTAETARWPPFLGAIAFRRVFGAFPAAVWREFEESWGLIEAPPNARVRRLTHDGFQTATPRWDPANSSVLFYERRTPHAFPSIQRLAVDSGETTEVTTMYHGESISVRGRRLVFDQLDFVSNAALVADIYVIDDVRGEVQPRRLTRGRRAGNPDLSPNGSRVAMVVTSADRRALATMDVAPGAGEEVTLASEAGVYYGHPRWSPDGTRLVAERQRRDVSSEIVVVDVATGNMRPLAAGIGDRQATPTWSPDGEFVVFAAATGQNPFNLVAVSVADGAAFQVTSLADGARSPDVSPDGKRIAFLGYTTAGEDVFVVAFDRSTWQPVEARQGEPVEAAASESPSAVSAVKSYSPLHGFVPRYWAPIVESNDDSMAIGAMTSGADALGRHAYDASLRVWTDTDQADFDVSYSYRRWKPWVFGTFSRETSGGSEGLFTSRAVSAGVVLPAVTVRQRQQVVGTMRFETLALDTPGGDRLTLNRNAVRLGWAMATENAFPYSISSEEGWVAALSSEHVRQAFGADGNADAFFADGRYYIRAGGPHAVVAARAAGAVSRGDGNSRQLFDVSGSGPVEGPLSFDSDAVALFRGGGTDGLVGSRAFVANVDYRFPIWRVERGVGSLPVFLRWAHGAVFVDLADSWNETRQFRANVAAGVEVGADVVVGHSALFALTTGVSWRVDHDRPGNSPHAFVRVGRAF